MCHLSPSPFSNVDVGARGVIELKGTGMTDLNELNTQNHFYRVVISSNPQLQTISGFTLTTNISTLTIEDNPLLLSLSGLSSLRSYSIALVNIPESLSDFKGLKEVG